MAQTHAVHTVTAWTDDGVGSLRYEINSAAAGDTIKFGIGGNVVISSSSIPVTKEVVIVGNPSNPVNITVNGAINFSVFSVTTAGKLHLKDLTVSQGRATQGGAVVNHGECYVENVAFRNCRASEEGGAIYNNGKLKVLNCSFSGNDAFAGAAIFTTDLSTTTTVLNSSFIGNANSSTSSCQGAGALHIASGQVFVANSTFTNNGVGSRSSAAITALNGSVTLVNNIIVGNNARTTAKDFTMNVFLPLVARYNLMGTVMVRDNGSNVVRDSVSATVSSAANIFETVNTFQDITTRGVVHRVCKIDRNKVSGRNGTLIGRYTESGVEKYAYADRSSSTRWVWKNCETNANVSASVTIMDRDEVESDRMVFVTAPRDNNWLSFGALAVQPEVPSTKVTIATDVVDPYDYQYSLREAVQYAENNGLAHTITFNIAGADYSNVTLNTPIVFNSAFTINGTNGSNVVTINGRNTMRPFDVNNVSLTLSNIKMVNGNAVDGGAVRVQGTYGSLTLTNCTFSNNNATTGAGGAVYVSEGALSAQNVSFTNNQAQHGGAVYLSAANGWGRINKATFFQNHANGDGGAINVNSSDIDIRNTTFGKNISNGNGGAIYLNGNTLALVSSTIHDNTANAGGGLYVNDGGATLLNNLVVGNSATTTGADIFHKEDISLFYTLYNSRVSDMGAAAVPDSPNTEGLTASDLFQCSSSTPMVHDVTLSSVAHKYYNLERGTPAASQGTKTATRTQGTREYAFFDGSSWRRADASLTVVSWPTSQTNQDYYTNNIDQIGQNRLAFQGVNSYTIGAIAYGRYEDTLIMPACDFYTMRSLTGGEEDTLTKAGLYTYNYTTVDGFDSIIHLKLTIFKSKRVELDTTVCDTYTWGNWYDADDSLHVGNGMTFTTSTSDSVVLLTQSACDSVEVLNLTVNYKADTAISEVACDTYTWMVTPGYPLNAVEQEVDTYTTSGEYNYHTTTWQGCDSTITLNLTVNHSSGSLTHDHGCDAYTWAVNSPFGGSETRNYEGFVDNIYDTIVVKNQYQCDSTVVLNLTVDTTTHAYFDTVACDQYQWQQYDLSSVLVHDQTYQYDFDQAVNRNTFTVTDNVTFANVKGCDSIHTMNLTLHRGSIRYNEVHDYSADTTAVECNSFEWYGHTYTQNTEPYTVFHHFENVWGCDSVTYLNLTINNTVFGEVDTTVCDQFVWSQGDGNTYENSTDAPQFTYLSNVGCDSIVTLHLTVNHRKTSIETQTVCDRFVWLNGDGNTYTESNDTATFNHPNANIHGCDSLVTLNLTVNYQNTGVDTVLACDSYTWNGITYTADNYGALVTLTNQQGCDSILTLNLTMHYSVATTEDRSACDFFTWEYNNQDYTTDTVVSHTLHTIHGCDSVRTLTLTMLHEPRKMVVATCDNYTWLWNGENYTTSGRYGYTPDGCSFADSLILTIRSSSVVNVSATSCDNYVWRGNTLTSTGLYNDIIVGANPDGCDSLLTLDLTVNRSKNTTVSGFGCDNFEWNGTTYTSTGTYPVHLTTNQNCDSIVTLDLIIRQNSSYEFSATANNNYHWPVTGTTYIESGTYTAHIPNAAGCDSSITLNLIVNHPTYRAFNVEACDTYTWIDTVETPSGIQVHTATYTHSDTYIYRYNNIHGCASADTLHLTIYNSVHGTTEPRSACDSYYWTFNGETYTNSGSYTYQYSTYDGVCNNDSTLILTIITGHHTSGTIAACESYVWSVTGQTYTTSGTYVQAHPTATGCDDTETLYLTINHHNTGFATINACDSYEWNGVVYTSDITTVNTLTNQWGCDSVTTLTLHIQHGGGVSESDSACIRIQWNNNGNIIECEQTGDYYSHYINPDNFCPAVDTLHFTRHGIIQHIDTVVCDQITFYGVVYTTPGMYSYDPPTPAPLNCVIHDTLHILEIHHSTFADDQVVSCGSYEWMGNVYDTPGTYTDATTSIYGCDSIVTLTLEIDPIEYFYNTVEACDSYTWRGHTYIETGIYHDTIPNAYGCGNIYTLDLTVKPSSHMLKEDTACYNYTWYGQTYTASGNYNVTFTAANGCDSVHTLALVINGAATSDTTAEACETFTWYGQTFTSTPTTAPVKHFATSHGCDSLVTLHLTVYHNSNNKQSVNVCESYLWYGQTYTTNGTYYHNETHVGCHVNDTLLLTLRHGTHNKTTQTVCDSYTWNSNHQTYTATGVYPYSYTNQENCPSTDTLDLTVNYSASDNVDTVVCDSYLWHDSLYTSTIIGVSTYEGVTAQGCPQRDTLKLGVRYSTSTVNYGEVCDYYEWKGNLYTETGVYTYDYINYRGCPSTDTLKLDVHIQYRNHDTVVACDVFRWHDVTYTENGVYPIVFHDNIGCISFDTLTLTVSRGTYEAYTAQACDSYTWDRSNQTYTQTGTYTYNYYNTSSCPSVDTLHLQMNYNTGHKEVINECDMYVWHDVIYTQSGIYYHNYSTAAGCASQDTLDLTIRLSTASTDVLAACDSLRWLDGHTYTVSNTTATYHLFNQALCDSTITLNLTINNSYHGTQSHTACDSLLWMDGVMYWTDTVATYHLLTQQGCDSSFTLNLTLTTDGNYHDTVSACDNYSWNGTIYETSGEYTYLPTGCSRRDTLHLSIYNTVLSDTVASVCDNFSWYGSNYTATGSYSHTFEGVSAHGCDSVVTLQLTVRQSNSSDTAAIACDNFTWYGTNYTEDGFHTKVFSNAENCDSTVTLHLTINRSTTLDTTVSACENFLWRGTNYKFTPAAPITETIVNTKGCDSTIVLRLTINRNTSSDTSVVSCNDFTWYGMHFTETVDTTKRFSTIHGCDSIVTLHLAINHRTDTLYNVVACNSYLWNGLNFTTSNTYIYHYDDAFLGCAGNDTLVLTIKQSTYTADSQTACEEYTWHDNSYTTSGTYTFDYLNAVGCPSTDTLHLTVNEGTNLSFTQTACEGFTWHNTAYTTSGTYTYSYSNAIGCPSTDTLRLTINHGTDSTWHVTACDSYTWVRNNQRYTDTINTAADYTNAFGCASHDSLVLIVKYSSHDTLSADVCDSYTWHGTSYTTSGNKLYNYTNSVDCPSVDTLHLTIRNSSHSDTTVAACGSFTWWRNNQTYTSGGLKRYTYTNAVGCPSADTLHLTVGVASHNVTTQTACDTYTWARNNQTYTTSGTRTYAYTNTNNCPSVDTLKLTINRSTTSDTTIVACDSYVWQGTNYTSTTTATHTFTNAHNCDSVRTLHLTIHNSHPYTQSLTVCDSLIWKDSVEYRTSITGPTYMTTTTHGCDSLITLDLTVNYSVAVHLHDSICEGDSYSFGGMSYNENGEYIERLLSSQQCDSITILHLTVLTHPIIYFTEQHSCTTYDYLLTPVCIPADSARRYHYTWISTPADPTMEGQENAKFLHVTPTQTTHYGVTVDYQGSVSCPSSSDTSLVKVVQPYAHAHISPDFMTYESHTITAIDQSVDHLSRAWYVDGSFYTDDPHFEYEANLMSDTIHVQLYVSTETCADSLKRDIPIKKSMFMIPNVFTPGEITNNLFKVQGHGIIEFEILIYNRSGLLVYSSNDMAEGWDGKHKGKDCPQSAYVYIIKYTTVDMPRGTQTLKGSVLLLR